MSALINESLDAAWRAQNLQRVIANQNGKNPLFALLIRTKGCSSFSNSIVRPNPDADEVRTEMPLRGKRGVHAQANDPEFRLWCWSRLRRSDLRIDVPARALQSQTEVSTIGLQIMKGLRKPVFIYPGKNAEENASLMASGLEGPNCPNPLPEGRQEPFGHCARAQLLPTRYQPIGESQHPRQLWCQEDRSLRRLSLPAGYPNPQVAQSSGPVFFFTDKLSPLQEGPRDLAHAAQLRAPDLQQQVTAKIVQGRTVEAENQLIQGLGDTAGGCGNISDAELECNKVNNCSKSAGIAVQLVPVLWTGNRTSPLSSYTGLCFLTMFNAAGLLFYTSIPDRPRISVFLTQGSCRNPTASDWNSFNISNPLNMSVEQKKGLGSQPDNREQKTTANKVGSQDTGGVISRRPFVQRLYRVCKRRTSGQAFQQSIVPPMMHALVKETRSGFISGGG